MNLNPNTSERLTAEALMQATAQALDITGNDYPARRLALALIGVESFRDSLRYLDADSIRLLAEIVARSTELYPKNPSRQKDVARVLCAAIHNAALLIEYAGSSLDEINAIAYELCKLPAVGDDGINLMILKNGQQPTTEKAVPAENNAPAELQAARNTLRQYAEEIEALKKKEAKARRLVGVYADLYDDLYFLAETTISAEAWGKHTDLKRRLLESVGVRAFNSAAQPEDNGDMESGNRDEVNGQSPQ